jgi:hypothetical protein
LTRTVYMKFKSIKFAPLPAIIGLAVAMLIAWGISRWTRFPFWIVIVAMIVNGIIAQHEDDAPGGFNNPHPPKQPDDIKRDA